jgi:uncharacterized protein YqjF (DUF2071 family)
MYQKWRSLLFLHWALPPEQVRPLLPAGLEVDTLEGRAYVGLIPFTMRGIRPAGLPPVPWLSRSHETNARTYVHVGGRDPGVWFFSLDASNPVAAALARALFHLPYYYARMTVEVDLAPDPAGALGGHVRYNSERRPPGPRPATTAVEARVPAANPAPSPVGTLDHFLIERYLLYCTRRSTLYRGQVHHAPYPVQAAEALRCDETILAAAGVARPAGPPLAHYSGGVDVEIFSLQRVAKS